MTFDTYSFLLGLAAGQLLLHLAVLITQDPS